MRAAPEIRSSSNNQSYSHGRGKTVLMAVHLKQSTSRLYRLLLMAFQFLEQPARKIW
jgi:hypothetical protein